MNNDEREGFPSCSGMEGYSLCPGKFLSERSVAKKKRRKAVVEMAEHGDTVHDLLRRHFSGETVAPEGVDPVVWKTFCKARMIAEDALAKWSCGEYPSLIVEARVWSNTWGDGFRFSGKPDIVAMIKKDGGHHILILDFKSLYGDHAKSPKNLQLRSLAAIHAMNPMIHSATVAIIQPNISSSVDFCFYSRPDLDRAIVESKAIVTASMTEGSPRVAGGVQCKYCTFKNKCDEYNAWKSGALIHPVGSLPPSTTWTPEMWMVFLEKEKEARDWIADRKAEAEEMLAENPDAIPMFALSEKGKITSTITDAIAAYKCLDDVIDRASFFRACKVTVTDLVAIVIEKTGCTETAAEKFVKERCIDFITTTESKRSITKIK